MQKYNAGDYNGLQEIEGSRYAPKSLVMAHNAVCVSVRYAPSISSVSPL